MNVKKLTEIREKHPLRLQSAKKPWESTYENVTAMLDEAVKKGYTIVPHNEGSRYGYVIYRDIDGEEIAYNPTWRGGELKRMGYKGLIKVLYKEKR